MYNPAKEKSQWEKGIFVSVHNQKLVGQGQSKWLLVLPHVTGLTAGCSGITTLTKFSSVH